jgi:hypothetical protein
VIEQVSFRLALLIAIVTLTGFGIPAYRARQEANRGLARFTVLTNRLDDRQHILSPEQFDSVNADRERVAERMLRVIPVSERYRFWAWLFPLLIVLGFYALRWALTGRLRPIWPLRRSPET